MNSDYLNDVEREQAGGFRLPHTFLPKPDYTKSKKYPYS
jgi:hypothetical protein